VFLLRGSAETRSELARPRKLWPFSKQKARSAAITMQHKKTIDSLILHKLKYDPGTHLVESCDWLNVLVAQVIASLRNDVQVLDGLAHKIDLLVNNEKRPAFMGPVSITELSLGEEYPEIKNARVALGDLDENMRVLLDFSYDDQVTFALDTQALINWPKPAIASLPMTLSFSLVRFSGTIVIEFLAGQIVAPSSLSQTFGTKDIDVSFFIMEDFVLDFGVGSLLGHRTKVKDLPKLTSLIVNALRQAFVKELVFPARKTFHIPRAFGTLDLKTAEAAGEVRLRDETELVKNEE
ncbi:ERMES complex subunit mmm1, partial [Kappamyces sp. JEL0680]